MGVVRQIGADLRNALTARLQSLSIGFHTRVSASIVQTKVVRDVENIELMLQQVTHAVLAADHGDHRRDRRDRASRCRTSCRSTR